jgi:hypothetical protein
MKSFYRSMEEDAPLTIPARDILLAARIIDSIFEQINSRFVQPGMESSPELHTGRKVS